MDKEQRQSVHTDVLNERRFNFETITVTKMGRKKGDSPRYLRNLEILTKVFVEDYQKWHRQHRLLFDSELGRNATVKVLIFRGIRKNTGLGDRLRAIARSYLTAVLTDRIFLIDIDMYNSFSTVFSNPKGYNFGFDLRKMYIGDDERKKNTLPSQVKVVHEYKQDELGVFLSDIPVIVVDDYHITDCRELSKAHTQMVSSKIKDAYKGIRKPFPKRDEIMPFVMNALFRSTEKFRRYLVHLEDQLGKKSHQPYISIHARIGMGLNETESRFNLKHHRLTENSLALCMAQKVFLEAQSRNISNPYTFFVSTDTPSFRTTLQKEIQRVDRNAIVFFGNWEPFHVRDLRAKKISDVEKVMNIFADLFFLSNGRFIFHIQSGFANLAKWFGSMTNEQSKMIILNDC